jgi:hypothetical protein
MNRHEPATSDLQATAQTAGEQLLRALNLACVAILAWLAVSLEPASDSASNWLAPREMSACVMDQDGYVRGQLYGAVQTSLDWSGADMLCDGMSRPQGRGIRLVFSGPRGEDEAGLVIVVGLEEAELGIDKGELTANVTIIDRGTGMFYSTQQVPRCWSQITSQLMLSGTAEETWRLDGRLYCASALAALTGPGSVTLDELEYSGIMKPADEQAIR